MALIHYRIFGYILTIALHIGNVIYMNSCFTEDTLKNEVVRNFKELQCFFLTCWTFVFQTVHAAVALYSDILTLRNSNTAGYKLPKIITSFRDDLYAILVWPCTTLVFGVFWSFYLFDRNLMYPEDIDLAISAPSNHIMHSWIIVASVSEILFRPKNTPRRHKWRVMTVWMTEAVYIVAFVGAYYYTGIWVYPLFGLLRGSIFFYVLLLVIGVILTILYHMQWLINDVVWSSKKNEKKIK